jgi:gluconokinase
MDETVETGLAVVPDFLSVVARQKPAYLLGLDVGTSGVRAALFDEHGNEIEGAEARSTRQHSKSSFGELDPDLIIAQVTETIDDLLSLSPLSDGRIAFMSLSCFWHSLLGIDGNDKPTTPLLTWADTRASSAVKKLRSSFNESEIHKRTGSRFHPSYWPAKLLWLKDERVDVFARTERWLGFSEYLGLCLFSDAEASASMASATGLFNQRDCDWDRQLIKELGIPRRTLPKIRSGFGPKLKREWADRWPVLSEASLITTLGDGAANNIGGGCCTKDRIALMIGTSGAMRIVYQASPPDDLPFGLWCYRVDRERLAVGGALSDGGGLFRWLTESLAIPYDTAELESELELLAADAHGLTVLPFWSGERSTGWAADARGAVLGLTQETKPIEIVRASMEAVAYRFASIARELDRLAPGATIVATGNALRSSGVWRQMIADVLGRRIMFGGPPEASLRGAALLALEAVGKIRSIEDLPVMIDHVVEPDMARHASYQKGLERQELYYARLFQ